MTIDIETVHRRLEAEQIRVLVPDDAEEAAASRIIYFNTRHYRNVDGEKSLFIIVEVSEGGQYLEMYAPTVFNVRSSRHKAAIFAIALHVAYCTKHVQCEYDPADGEIRFTVDIPVCDGDVTSIQLLTMVVTMARVVDRYAPVFMHAIETGLLDFELAEFDEEEPGDVSEELEGLLEEIGGMDVLREIAVRLRRARGES